MSPAHLASALGALKSTQPVWGWPTSAPFDTERVRWPGRAFLKPQGLSSAGNLARNAEKEG